MLEQSMLPSVSLTRTPQTSKGAHKPHAEAAKDFEAMMLSSMLESMFKGVRTDGMFGGGHSEEIWRTFMLQEYANLMAESGTTGVGQSIEKMLGAYRGGQTSFR